MFNGLFQPTHLILILVVVLIIFGPGKLPEAGKALGNALRDMRNAFAGSDEDEQAANGRKKNSGGEQVVVSKVSENTHIN
jgi:sec-independent protein translocase protein TatA